MKTVIFDLDGTLADTAADLVGALNEIGATRGWPALDPVGERIVAGQGGRALLRRGMSGAGLAVDEAHVDALFPEYLAVYERQLSARSSLFPGAVECLDALAADGWGLGICTNKPERLARGLLEALGVAGRFGAILGADTLAVRKPDPLHLLETVARLGGDPARTVLVGDTVTDRETARRAGAPCILCRFGYAVEPLADLAPDAVIDDLREVVALAPALVAARAA